MKVGILIRFTVTETEKVTNLSRYAFAQNVSRKLVINFPQTWTERNCWYDIPTQDMPYTKDGITPDIIINPAIKTLRLTAQLIECILGKICVNVGGYGDGSPSMHTKVHDVAEMLEACGFEQYGNEVLAMVSMAVKWKLNCLWVPYYQRLRIWVEDKVHSRVGLPVLFWTRQPVWGRTRERWSPVW